MKKSLLASLLAVVAVAGAALAISPLVGAAEDTGKENLRGSLYVTPPIFKLDDMLLPGNSYTMSFEAMNNGDEPISFQVSAETMQTPPSEDYVMHWGASPSQYNKIINWVTFNTGTSYELEAGGSTNVEFTIDVPSDAAGGAQYFMVVAKLDNSETGESNAWQVQSALGIQVYSNVDGEINFGGNIIAQDIPWLTFDPIIRTYASVENTGNINFDAQFKVEIRNYFNDILAWEDTQEKIILPDTTRGIRQDWEHAPQLGIFRVTSTVTIPGRDSAVLTQVVIIIPIWLIILILVIIVLLILGIIYKIKKGGKSSRFENR